MRSLICGYMLDQANTPTIQAAYVEEDIINQARREQDAVIYLSSPALRRVEARDGSAAIDIADYREAWE